MFDCRIDWETLRENKTDLGFLGSLQNSLFCKSSYASSQHFAQNQNDPYELNMLSTFPCTFHFIVHLGTF